MQFEKNTDSNKRSVYSDLLFVRVSIFRVQNRPPALFLPPLPLTPRKSRILSYIWLSLKRNNCSRTMHLLEVLHIRQQHDTNRNKNTLTVKERKRKLSRVFGKHLRASWYRSFSQKLANRKTVKLPRLMHNVFFKTFDASDFTKQELFRMRSFFLIRAF